MIKLPKLFEAVIAKDSTLHAAVSQSFRLFEPWLEQSGMPFFPGFTDHSPRHINDVLNTAASLISDAGHELLTPEDVAVLCIASLIHDAGMHLTQDGFRVLIENSAKPAIIGFNDQPWAQLWKDYVAEARRFGQDKLLAIFGDTEPVRPEEIDYKNLSERDYLLIGEFVRRHHARLAHEIALYGVPSRAKEKLELVGLDPDLRDIAGLIARSHGTSIRGTFGYLEEKYGLIPEQRRAKGPFLMAVLRIADYIQVQSERALKSLLSVKELRSPISKQEWRNHFAVKDVSPWHDDPEAFFVNAAPSDAKTYLRLVKLFADIQRELDESWATLGEVYGRRGALAKLGITMRRIRSNLDSPDKFAKTVPYIPIKANFDSSGPDLLRLLVGPLYNYDYAIGIRELIQNAVDACRERSDFLNESHVAGGSSSKEEPDVIASIEENDDGTGWITIVDQGVGMTLDTVTKYFLIAGASFRNSDLWKKQHLDETGQSRIMRGGRFGIGALAAFLLGEEIQVKTRHFSRPESDGLEFRARIDDPDIELRRCIAPAGTSIKIWVADTKVIDELRPYVVSDSEEQQAIDSWRKVDWFVQAVPRVEFRWNGFEHSNRSVAQRQRITAKFSPDDEKCVPLSGTSNSSWERLPEPAPYKDIYWRYIEPIKRSNGQSSWTVQPDDEITVNGIRVESISHYYSRSHALDIQDDVRESGPQYIIKRPSLAIFDPAGICPINLQRSSVAFDRMGFDLALARSILGKHLERLVEKASSARTFGELRKLCLDLRNSRDVVYSDLVAPLLATSKGIGLYTGHLINKLKIRRLFLVATPEISDPEHSIANTLESGEALMIRLTENGKQNDLAWFRATTSSNAAENWYATETGLPPVSNNLVISIMSAGKWAIANEKGRVTQYLLRQLSSRPLNEDLVEVASGDTGNPQAMDALASRCMKLMEVFGQKSEIVGWSINVAPHEPADESSLFLQVWSEITKGTLLLPFRTKS